MLFRDMNLGQLRASRADHEARIKSGRGTDTYRTLLKNAIKQIDLEIEKKENAHG